MKSLFKLCTALLLSFAVISTACSQDKGNSKVKANEKIPLLFVLSAKEASISRINNKITLNLEYPNHKIMYFSDRPKRIAGQLPIQTFIAAWGEGKDSFKMEPPNAVLVHEGSEKGIVLELMDISLNESGTRLTFKTAKDAKLMDTVKGVFLFVDSDALPGLLGVFGHLGS